MGWSGDSAAPRELYHVSVDPLENFDVSQRPELRRMKQRLLEWMTERQGFALSGEAPERLDGASWGGGIALSQLNGRTVAD